MEQQIKAAVISILNQLSSGTAASILGNNDNNGATLLQALFFPTKQFTDPTSADWVGELQSFWYYLDPLLTNINIREDTVKDNKLKLSEDHIAEFSFDAVNSIVNVNLFNDNGSGGKGTAAGTVTVDNVKTIWNAGTSLWARTASDRTIYANDPSVTTDSRVLFTSTNQAKFTPYLDVASDAAKAGDVLNFIRGENVTTTGYRSRQVTTTDTTLATPAAGTHVWKLGDIINSTPKLLSKGRLNSFDTTYKDKSYGSFINSINLSDDNSALYDGYKKRGTAFVGANDGMLHAFNIGVNFTGTAGYVSELKNSDGSSPATNLGKELWGFIPKNAMPYLKHFGAIGYKHLFYVDATPLLIDASIGITKYKYYDTPPSTAVLTCTSSTYYDCPKVTTTGGSGSTSYVSYNSTPDPAAVNTSTGTSWRTVLLGAMGYGGATRESTSSCSTTTDCVKVPPDVTIGYSSYFALDVTKQDAPALLWEFGNPLLGYSTVGASVVRIKSANDTGSPVARNGRWFAVLASGPTGPVDTTSRQMKAFSDQPLRIFVLDLKTGAVLRTFSNEAGTALSGMPAGTHFRVPGMPSNAFAGSLSNATIDTDQWDLTRAGSYSDDAIYVNYSRKNTDSADAAHGLGKFSEGGILRILTGDNPDPSKWKVSTVIDGVGPITSGIAKLQDKAKGTLWLYFGTGRYYYKTGLTIDEDYGSPAAQNQQLAIYGIKEPCYNSSTNDLDKLTDANGVSDCVTQIGTSANPVGSLDNRTTTSSAASTNGWFINLALESTSFKAQRVISDPVATSTGTVFFTAFKPSTDFCGYGGDSSLWAVSYDTGGALGGASGSSKIAGQALMQLSTGAFQQVDLHATFGSGSRESASFKGVPPKSPPAITSNADHFPSKRVLHIMER